MALTSQLVSLLGPGTIDFSTAFKAVILDHRGTVEEILHHSLDNDEITLDDLSEEVQVRFMGFIEELLLAVNPPQPIS